MMTYETIWVVSAFDRNGKLLGSDMFKYEAAARNHAKYLKRLTADKITVHKMEMSTDRE